jgi:PleD family two-component response regulator
VTTVSIGLATNIDKNDFTNLIEFIAAADKALYQAKNCLAIY